jgi:hypothetical protein
MIFLIKNKKSLILYRQTQKIGFMMNPKIQDKIKKIFTFFIMLPKISTRE